MAPAIGLEFAVIPIAQQRVVVRIRFQVDASAMTAVAPGRAAARHKFLATERHAPVPAAPGLHKNLCFVNKHSPYFLLKNDTIGVRHQRKSRNFWRSLIVSPIRVWLRRAAILLVLLAIVVGIGAYVLYFHRDAL